MEDRVKKVEDGLSELKTEIKLMTHTLEAINNTLIEFKVINTSVTKLQINQSNMMKDIENIDNKIGILFKKLDNTEGRLQKVEASDILQNSKMGDVGKFIWMLISVIITIIGGYFTLNHT